MIAYNMVCYLSAFRHLSENINEGGGFSIFVVQSVHPPSDVELAESGHSTFKDGKSLDTPYIIILFF